MDRFMLKLLVDYPLGKISDPRPLSGIRIGLRNWGNQNLSVTKFHLVELKFVAK